MQAEYRRKTGGSTKGQDKVSQLEAQLATQKALNKVWQEKYVNKQPKVSSAKTLLAEIMETDDIDEKEAALIELANKFHRFSVNMGASSTYYLFANVVVDLPKRGPIINSGASMSFVTSDADLTNPRKHKTAISTANGQNVFTKSMGKYKLTNSNKQLFVTALSEPSFTHNLISVIQLTEKHNALLTRNG